MKADNDEMFVETIVIGGGQAGLATGYHLAKRGRDFVVLDDQRRVGDNWRRHWDSLRLFSPAKIDGLPGMDFPADPNHFPTKDEMAAFLEAYRTTFDLPVLGGSRVRTVSKAGGGYRVTTVDGTSYTCDNVVIATGTFGLRPNIPAVAAELSPATRQLHSSEYQRPEDLLPGKVLVVGASHSGGDIAYELGRAGHEVVLSGAMHGQLPFDIESRRARMIWPLLSFAWRHVLTLRTPPGRRMRAHIRAHGGPLIRVKKEDLAAAGVEMTAPRVVAAKDGKPMLADDRVLDDVVNVVWCTGFRQDFSWVDLPIVGDDGWPLERRGVVASAPGLYFVGLSFQYAFISMFVGGAGRDAEYVVKHLVARSKADRSAAGRADGRSDGGRSADGRSVRSSAPAA
jgi:putative flavoprotein involved in K+ transport